MALQHHIQLGPEHLEGNGGLGRYVFLPGDRSRAARIAGHFTDATTVDNPRGYTGHLGKLESGVDVLVFTRFSCFGLGDLRSANVIALESLRVCLTISGLSLGVFLRVLVG